MFTDFLSVLLHISSTFRRVENIGLRGPILGYFGPLKISKSSGIWSFSQTFSLWFRISLCVHVNVSYFKRCGEYWHQRPNFRVILGPKINHDSGLQSFLKYVPFVSHHTWFTCLLGYLHVCFNYVPQSLYFWAWSCGCSGACYASCFLVLDRNMLLVLFTVTSRALQH